MPTVLIEGFAYVIAAFAAYVHSAQVIRPQRYGFADWKQAYSRGLGGVASVFAVAVLILVGAALYEAFEVIHLVPLVSGQPLGAA